MSSFFEKKQLFVFSRGKLTRGYGTIISVVKVLFHYELECPIRAMFFYSCMVKAQARGQASIMDLIQYARGGQNTYGGHQIGCISTIFSCNCINFEQEAKFDIKFNMLGNKTHLLATK